MLDKMTRDDLLPGMTVTTRDGAIGTVKICSIRLVDHEPIMAIDYTDDLYYGDGDEEHDLDIMRVTLPSGAVIWERPVTEIRVFEFKLFVSCAEKNGYKSADIASHREAMFPIPAWFDSFDGKLISFKDHDAERGSYCGYDIRREWTRELTDEERKNWRKEHPRT